MNNIVILDTETTGFLNKYGETPRHQARVCQLAAVLCDPEGKILWEFSHIIYPDGWEIPEGAAKVHGITTERAKAEGVHFVDAIKPLEIMYHNAKLAAVYNADFDMPILAREYHIHGRMIPYYDCPVECILAQATPICNLPPTDRMKAAGFNKPKPPKLEEAYRIICGKEMTGAHDALADARAAAEVYFALAAKKPAK